MQACEGWNMFKTKYGQHRGAGIVVARLAATVLACSLVAVILLQSGVSQALERTLLPSGSQTVVLKVLFRSGGKTSFSGMFAGRPLQGKFERSDPAITKRLCPNNASIQNIGTNFTYGGKFGATAYSFSGCIQGSANPAKISFRMVGKVGSVAMSGSTTSYLIKGSKLTLPFKGKVGSQIVTGSATLSASGNGSNTAESLVARLKITN
jgi:hypothetical protein